MSPGDGDVSDDGGDGDADDGGDDGGNGGDDSVNDGDGVGGGRHGGVACTTSVGGHPVKQHLRFPLRNFSVLLLRLALGALF